jgi:hypothetical protein
MPYKSLAFSIAIFCIMLGTELTGSLAEEAKAAGLNNSFGTFTPGRNVGADDLGLNQSQDSIDYWGIENTAQDEQGRDGTKYGEKSAMTVLWSIAVKGSTGFYEFACKMAHVDSQSEGTDDQTARWLIAIASALINLNHLVAVLQLIPGVSFGGKV